ncbi:hypothetical protein VCCP1050_1778, partial [Vibrio cholerae CP1050(23)]
MAGNWG